MSDSPSPNLSRGSNAELNVSEVVVGDACLKIALTSGGFSDSGRKSCSGALGFNLDVRLKSVKPLLPASVVAVPRHMPTGLSTLPTPRVNNSHRSSAESQSLEVSRAVIFPVIPCAIIASMRRHSSVSSSAAGETVACTRQGALLLFLACGLSCENLRLEGLEFRGLV